MVTAGSRNRYYPQPHRARRGRPGHARDVDGAGEPMAWHAIFLLVVVGALGAGQAAPAPKVHRDATFAVKEQ